MRRAGIVFSALLAAGPAALAQTPFRRPPARQRDRAGNTVAVSPALQAHLAAWEKKAATVTSYYAECEFVRKETIRRRDTTYAGTLMCMKPNLARMRIDNKADKTDYKAYIADGRAVYEYDGREKVVSQYAIPPGGKGGVGDNLLMEFMSGSMTAEDVKTRFVLNLEKEEDHYTHIKITPKLDRDRQEFDTMLLVLYSGKLADRGWDYLPAVVVMSKQGGQEVEQWTFKEPKINHPGVKKDQFVAMMPDKKDGWQFKQVNAAAAPKPGTPVVSPQPKTVRP